MAWKQEYEQKHPEKTSIGSIRIVFTSLSIFVVSTVNLSYDHTNSYESDYTVVTELTGKAAEYAKDHPDFEQKFENPFGFLIKTPE